MLIVGFNLAAADYRRSRRTVLLLSGLSAALLLLLGRLAQRDGQRETPVGEPDDEHRPPLQALGLVHAGERDALVGLGALHHRPHVLGRRVSDAAAARVRAADTAAAAAFARRYGLKLPASPATNAAK